MANGVKSVMVELNRFDQSEGDILQKGARYIRTTGDEQPACERPLGLSYTEFENAFYALRYTTDVTPEQTAAAIEKLHAEAAQMFDGIDAGQSPGTTQVDVVTSASELWAFPFEAFARDHDDLVITRRIRGSFGQHVAWPAVPKVLFVHAALGDDLPPDLIERHVLALVEAFEPWTGMADPRSTYLVVKEVYSLADLRKARDSDEFTHIHVLAHGVEVPSKVIRGQKVWGIRLGPPKSAGVHPDDFAQALEPRGGLPVTITVASCDSANQSDSAPAAYSIAQLLHRSGVSVVVGSQLPLTKHGSEVLTKEFYTGVLNGDDVRKALHNARVALRNDAAAKHDWLSVVAYVRLPETYEEHLDQVALKMEIAKLRAAHRRMDAALRANDDNALAQIEESIRERIVSLGDRLPNIVNADDRLECQGLLANAYKRLAELLFLAKRDGAEQLSALNKALEHYGAAFQSDYDRHWHGVQQLALQAALHGAFDPIDYEIVLRSAKKDVKSYWHLGTLAELYLLSSVAQKPYDEQAASSAVRDFCRFAAGKPDDIDSTRRQLLRYKNWWTRNNQFQIDLGDTAAALAALLPEEPNS